MKRWSGTHLRIVYLYYEPFNFPVMDPVTGKVRLHGLVGAVIDNVTTALNITYSLVPPSDGKYGLVDELTQKVIGMPATVLDGEAEIAAGPFAPHSVFVEQMHEISRVYASYSSFAIVSGMKNAYHDSPTKFTEAFDATTWQMLFAGYAAVHLMFFLHSILSERAASMSIFDAFTKFLFEMFAVLLQEATSEAPPKMWFERLMRGLWLIACMLLSNTFLGAMRANLIVLTPTLRIDNLQQLVQHPQLTIYFPAKTPAENLINTTRGDVGRKLRENIRTNSVGVIPFTRLHDDSVRDALASRKGVALIEEKFMKMGVSKWCVESPYYFYFASEPVTHVDMCFLASKRLPIELRKEIDMSILWVQASGLPFMRGKELIIGHLGCLAGTDMKTSDTMKAVQMRDIDTVNISLLIGYVLAIFMFVVEIVLFKTVRYCYFRKVKFDEN